MFVINVVKWYICTRETYEYILYFYIIDISIFSGPWDLWWWGTVWHQTSTTCMINLPIYVFAYTIVNKYVYIYTLNEVNLNKTIKIQAMRRTECQRFHFYLWKIKPSLHYYINIIAYNCHSTYHRLYSISQEICTRFLLCCCYTLTDFPISIRLTSLALWQSNDCPSASKATLINMDKYFMWINYQWLHNHNKVKHNKTVCIFLGIYCNTHSYFSQGRFTKMD